MGPRPFSRLQCADSMTSKAFDVKGAILLGARAVVSHKEARITAPSPLLHPCSTALALPGSGRANAELDHPLSSFAGGSGDRDRCAGLSVVRRGRVALLPIRPP